MNFICTSAQPDPHDLMQRVVVRHIVDGLTSGDPTAAALARSLMTELHAAGVPVDALVSNLRKAGA